MPHIDARSGEVVIRIVYDGAPEAGKTTNIAKLGSLMSLQRVGAAKKPGTTGDRTEYFDWLDFAGGYLDGRRVRCQLVSVPGQSSLLHRRRYLLEKADAIVFVADSRRPTFEDSIRNLSTTVQIVERLAGPVPVGVILQANKQDLPGAMPPPDVARHIGISPVMPVIGGIAARGDGVMQTFILAVRLATDRVRAILVGDDIAAMQADSETPEALFTAMLELEKKVVAEAGNVAASATDDLEPPTIEIVTIDDSLLEEIDDDAEVQVEVEPVRAGSIEMAARRAAEATSAAADARRVPPPPSEPPQPPPLPPVPTPPPAPATGYSMYVDAARLVAERARVARAAVIRRESPPRRPPVREEAIEAAWDAVNLEAAREQAMREQAARQQAERERAERERAEREQAEREQALRAQAEREQAEREQALRAQAEAEQADRERAQAARAREQLARVLTARANPLHSAGTRPRLPNATEIGSGHIWPPVKGRASIAVATSGRISIPDTVQPWAPIDAFELVSDAGYIFHSAERWSYESESVARHRLLSYVRGQIQRGGGIPEGRTLAVARDGERWRLWLLTPTMQPLSQRVIAAIDAPDLSVASLSMKELLGAMRELGELGLGGQQIAAGMSGLAVHERRLAVLPLDEVDSDPPLERRDPFTELTDMIGVSAAINGNLKRWFDEEGHKTLMQVRAP